MLSQDIARHIDLHQAMGFKFRTQSLLLRNFSRFAEHRKDRFIRTSRVLEWAAQAPSPPQPAGNNPTLRFSDARRGCTSPGPTCRRLRPRLA